jgi:hypothetical protein
MDVVSTMTTTYDFIGGLGGSIQSSYISIGDVSISYTGTGATTYASGFVGELLSSNINVSNVIVVATF